jgi:hypothetical protein
MSVAVRTAGRLVAALLLATAFFLPAARAHESRPAYLEIKETAPGQFSVLWRTPVRAGMRLPLVLKMPDGVKNLKEPMVQELTDSLVERRWIDAGRDGLAGKRVEIVGLQFTITDALVRVQLLDGRTLQTIARPSQPWVEIAASQTWLEVVGTYVVEGICHILFGFDHLLFVLGLLLIVKDGWMLVKTVTAFTLAHSITLGVATLGLVHVPRKPIEAAIALSIVFVAAEIAHGLQGRLGLTVRWPWVVAFTFGLLHGFGFAGALAEIGLPQKDIPLALLTFNVGVELGQFMFIAAVVILGWAARRLLRSVPQWAPTAAAYGIGSMSAFWFFERVAGFWT